MEEQSQPVFRDFLGPAAPNSNDFNKQPEMSATDSVRVSQTSGFMEVEDGEASVRGGSTFSAPCPSAVPAASSFPASSDPGAEIWRHNSRRNEQFNPCLNDDGRKRDERGSSLRDNLLHESLEGSRPMKVSRFKQNDALPTGAGTGTGDIGLSMQPPRASQSGMNAPWFQTSVFKADPSNGSSKRLESSGPLVNAGVPLPRSNPVGSAAAGTFPRNSSGAAVMQPPPADEGSRTGLQGGGIAALINNPAAGAAPAAAKLPASARAGPGADAGVLDRSSSGDRFKLPFQSAGSDPPLPPSSHKASSVTRQLTIFYGGQAHVFDDVSPEKADRIMALAGSNGTSWSTTYAHRSSRSEGSLGDLDRRRDKVVNGSSQDMQNILHGLNNQAAAGQPRKHRFPAEQIQQSSLPWSSKLPSGKLPRPCDS